MNCEKTKSLLQGYVENDLPHAKRSDVDQHLQSCTGCRQELEQIVELQELIEREPEYEPPESLKEQFNEALLSEIAQQEAQERNRSATSLASLWEVISPKKSLAFRFAAGALILACGIVIGYKFRAPDSEPTTSEVLAQLQQDMDEMKAIYLANALSLPRPSQRLQALVSYEPSSFSPEATAAYLQALRQDSNVNIRLAALQILSEYSNRQEIRDELLVILKEEKEPLIQVSIIRLFEHSIDDRILPTLQNLILSDETNDYVKGYAMKAIQKIEIEGYAKSITRETL